MAESVERDQLYDTRCNMCGKEFKFWDHQNNFHICKPYIGYGSKNDGEAVMMRLCCECADQLFDNCKIKPIIDCSGAEG